MIPEARTTVRNAGWLLLQRGLLVLNGLLFAAIVPRLMGPGTYGRFVLVSSLAFGFVLFSNSGTTQIIGRFVPELKFKGNLAGIRQLFSNLLTLCLISGGLVAAIYFVLTTQWLHDLGSVNLLIMSIVVLLFTINQLVFALFLGLNQAARWSLSDVLRRWLTLLMVVPGFYLAGLPGACYAVLLTELAVAAIGLSLARDYLARPQLDIRYLTPYLQFGLIFYGSGLLQGASERSSEALVQLASGNYSEVGYFSLAYAIYQMAVLTISQLTLAFAPLLAMLRTQDRNVAIRSWVERLLKWFAVAAIVLIYGALFLAENLVPAVFGAAYRAVVGNLLPLMVALLFLSLSQVAHLLAIVYELPRHLLSASALRLLTLWVLGLPPLPNDLNLDSKSRLSALAAWIALSCLVVGLFRPWAGVGTLLALALVAGLNAGLYRFFARCGGPLFLFGTVGLHFLYLLYSSAVFVVIAARVWLKRQS